MRILILGGTRFVGRHMAAEALRRGHRLTLFNRGRQAPGLFTEAESLRGDRDGDLAVLAGRGFDAVIDTSGYFPAQVQASTSRLRATAAHYTFVSSGSVYRDPVAAGSDECAPTWTLTGPVPKSIATPQQYGALKVMCEQVVQAAFAGGCLVVRPGIVTGPWDPSGRIAYWVGRMTAGGRVLAADPAQPVQFIDARDPACWVLDSVERRRAGTFNAAGPAVAHTMRQLLRLCAGPEGDGHVCWTGDEFLHEHGVSDAQLPLWVPRELAGFFSVSAARAVAAGLAVRPAHVTIADTAAWAAGRPLNPALGLSPRRERQLLAEWDRRTRGAAQPNK